MQHNNWGDLINICYYIIVTDIKSPHYHKVIPHKAKLLTKCIIRTRAVLWRKVNRTYTTTLNSVLLTLGWSALSGTMTYTWRQITWPTLSDSLSLLTLLVGDVIYIYISERVKLSILFSNALKGAGESSAQDITVLMFVVEGSHSYL